MKTRKKHRRIGGLITLASVLIYISGLPVNILHNYVHKQRYKQLSEHIYQSKEDGRLEFELHNKRAYDYNADGNLDFQCAFYPYRICGVLCTKPNHRAWNKKTQLDYSKEFKNIFN